MLCDICIGEDDDSDTEEVEGPGEPSWTRVRTTEEPAEGELPTPKYRDSKGNAVKLRKGGTERRIGQANGYVSDRALKADSPEIELTELRHTPTGSGSFDRLSLSSEKEDKEEHIDSEQDCAIAGLVSMVVMYVICVKRWNRFLEVSA